VVPILELIGHFRGGHGVVKMGQHTKWGKNSFKLQENSWVANSETARSRDGGGVSAAYLGVSLQEDRKF